MQKDIDFSTLLKDLPQIISTRAVNALAKIRILTVRDLLTHLPSRYENRCRLTPIAALQHGEVAQVCAKVLKSSIVQGKRRVLNVEIADDAGDVCKLAFFNFYKNQTEQYKIGRRGIFYGKAQLSPYGNFVISHPETTWLADGEIPEISTNLSAIYPTVKTLPQQEWRAAISAILKNMANYFEKNTQDALTNLGYFSLEQALNVLHRPTLNDGKREITLARNRLALEELAAHRLAMLDARSYLQSFPAPALPSDGEKTREFLATLPFSLTNAQERVRREIAADLAKNIPMLRLVQGDVGSGKTMIALFACLAAVDAGLQAVFMAPTELLAEQHDANLRRYTAGLGIEIVLLISKKTAKEKREILGKIKDGTAQIIIGTHAVFQTAVEYHNLALIVIDEQHRFGVGQRLKLQEKSNQGTAVHQLVLTATPIPRTLAMSNYGELDTSIIDELPAGRTPVRTTVISSDKREILLERIKAQVATGAQVYWVCPLIEESEVLECENAETIYVYLQEQLAGIRIALIHGRIESARRREIMEEFATGNIDLLVATTVIEVGVDVPNASLMIIENSERFGLSQLHQLRGRVGRGTRQSDCVLMYQVLGKTARRRLEIMRKTNDGFLIAEEDLNIRGAGELLGTQQTGEAGFLVADLVEDRELVEKAENLVCDWKKNEENFCQILLNRWAEGKEKYLQV
ncbi:MAG: ATP-dependent DNA helicase RecG [Cardiobacteriaceae bacterium]|nr:ATP-dependent DNA helicase RecG [Cardiobacteriaceae bacterium]